jgi:hydrogenase maturation protease
MFLVIGCGNTLRGDDGAGPAVLRLLAEAGPRPEVRLLAVHQLVPELSEAASLVDGLIVVDASTEGRPGEVLLRAIESAGRPRAGTSHAFSPEDLVEYARRLYGRAPPAVVVSIAGHDFGLREGLSPEVRRGVEEAARRIEEHIGSGRTEEDRCTNSR